MTCQSVTRVMAVPWLLAIFNKKNSGDTLSQVHVLEKRYQSHMTNYMYDVAS